VKFVIDHQLPPALARFLETQGHVASHVRKLGLKASDDATIWKHAVANELVVFTRRGGQAGLGPDGQLSNAISA